MRAPDASTRRADNFGEQQHDGHAGKALDPTASNVTIGALLESVADMSIEKYLATHEPAAQQTGATGYLLDRYGLTMTPEDVAGELHQSPQHIRALCREKHLPAVLVGRRWHVSTVRLGQLIDEGTVVY